MKNKKGNAVVEGITILIVLFIFTFTAIIGFNIFSDVNDEIQSDNTLSNESKAISDDLHTRYPSLFDGIFIFILIGLWFSAIIFAFFIDAHPIFLVVTIILMIIILVLASYLSNAYTEVLATGDFASDTTNFPMMGFVLNHLLETILVIITSIAIALYAKQQ